MAFHSFDLIKNNSKFWQQGDLLISFNSPSLIALYRPNENRIVWVKNAPWDKLKQFKIEGEKILFITNDNDGNYLKIFQYSLSNKKIETFWSGIVQEIKNEIIDSFDIADNLILLNANNYGMLLVLHKDSLFNTIHNQLSRNENKFGVYKRPDSYFLSEKDTKIVSENYKIWNNKCLSEFK